MHRIFVTQDSNFTRNIEHFLSHMVIPGILQTLITPHPPPPQWWNQLIN